MHKVMMLSPHKSRWGTCMLQSWIQGFNPNNLSNLLLGYFLETCLVDTMTKHMRLLQS